MQLLDIFRSNATIASQCEIPAAHGETAASTTARMSMINSCTQGREYEAAAARIGIGIGVVLGAGIMWVYKRKG